MTPDQFLARCNQLWHVAPAGAWDAISARGLQTAQQLIEAADLDEEARAALLSTPRAESVRLKVDQHEVQLRDQEILVKTDITERLDPGTDISDWVRQLNRRVYLFTDKAPMQKLLDKYVERDGAQEVLTFSPRRLLEAVRPQIELAAQSSGATARRTDPSKGRDSFLSITRFPDKKPAEVTIVDGLTDLTGIVMRVERYDADGRTAITV